MLFSKPSKTIGVDIGSHSVKAVQMTKSGGRLRVDQVGYGVVDRNQVNIDPIAAQAAAVRDALLRMNLQQSLLVGSLPGQNVVIRYPHLADMPENQLAEAIENEAGQNIPYELSEVYLDWSLLEKISDNQETTLRVILVAAKHEVIESRIQIAEAAEIQYSVLGVDSLALADAAECCDFLRTGESVALLNLGATTTSIHFIKDGLSNFIRDITWGGRELIQAIAKNRRCEYPEAEKILATASLVAPSSAPAQPESEGPAEEKSGGGSPLDPLDDELGGLNSGPGSPGSSRGQMGGPGAPAEKDLREILSGPLSRLVTEIRRSFDYYEQQLYEKPVERLILSGGVAQLPGLAAALGEELGLDSVEIADPTASALILRNDAAVADMRQQPTQYMVAVGLAARGAAEL
ncbi:MAG: type IV pilus assembly protein PilM [Candidatus Hydrogenedentota bacterium]